MRKYLAAGLAVAVAGAGAGAAFAQDPAPSITATAKVSPTKAGTKKKPKNTKLTLSIKNDPASKTTMKSLDITLPKTLKVSAKGFKSCKADTLRSDGLSGCNKKAIVGKGTSTVILGPHSTTPTNIDLDVTAVVGGAKELNFYVKGSGQWASINGVVDGKLKGQKLSLTIPDALIQPGPGTFTALNDIDVKIGGKAGKRFLIGSTGCKSKKQSFDIKMNYTNNEVAPAAPNASTTADAKCK